MKSSSVLISILQLHKTAAGAMRNTFEQIRYFKAQGMEVHVIADLMDEEAVLKAGAIPHTTWKWPGTGTFRRKFYNWQAQRWVKKNRPALVVGHGDLMKQDVLCLHNSVHLAHELIHGRPLPVTAEMYPIHTPQLEQKSFKHLIANSQMMKDDLVKRFKIPASSITVVYPAYAPEQFFPVAPGERQKIREGLGIKADELVVGLITSGNFKKRGVDIFLEALGLLPQEMQPKLRVWIVGKDTPPKPDLPIKVEFPPVRKDVETYYRALDLFVLPARVEEFGRVQLEAMACGCPVLSTSHVGASELLTGEARDFIISHLTAGNLAQAMTKMLGDPALRERLSTLSPSAALPASEAHVGQHFDGVFKPLLRPHE